MQQYSGIRGERIDAVATDLVDRESYETVVISDNWVWQKLHVDNPEESEVFTADSLVSPAVIRAYYGPVLNLFQVQILGFFQTTVGRRSWMVMPEPLIGVLANRLVYPQAFTVTIDKDTFWKDKCHVISYDLWEKMNKDQLDKNDTVFFVNLRDKNRESLYSFLPQARKQSVTVSLFFNANFDGDYVESVIEKFRFNALVAAWSDIRAALDKCIVKKQQPCDVLFVCGEKVAAQLGNSELDVYRKHTFPFSELSIDRDTELKDCYCYGSFDSVNRFCNKVITVRYSLGDFIFCARSISVNSGDYYPSVTNTLMNRTANSVLVHKAISGLFKPSAVASSKSLLDGLYSNVARPASDIDSSDIIIRETPLYDNNDDVQVNADDDVLGSLFVPTFLPSRTAPSSFNFCYGMSDHQFLCKFASYNVSWSSFSRCLPSTVRRYYKDLICRSSVSYGTYCWIHSFTTDLHEELLWLYPPFVDFPLFQFLVMKYENYYYGGYRIFKIPGDHHRVFHLECDDNIIPASFVLSARSFYDLMNFRF